VEHVVELRTVVARPTVVVAAATTWREFPSVWRGMLDEVWACLNADGIRRGCRNVMVYKDDVPNVEVGVELASACRLRGRVVASTLPAGRVAVTMHRGGYDGLRSAHGAVVRWCAVEGWQLAGPRWEIYGPHRDDPAELEVEVHYLLLERGQVGRLLDGRPLAPTD
jgi:effector-binding domain-containing protein